MSNTVDISGLGKPEVLMALFNAAQPGIQASSVDDPLDMELEDAQIAIEQMTAPSILGVSLEACLELAELDGRNLYVAIGGDTFDPCGFDDHNGYPGLAAAVIDELRQRQLLAS